MKDSPLYLGLLRHTPLGDLWLAVSEKGLVAVEWVDDELAIDAYLTKRLKRTAILDTDKTSVPLRQLTEYLRGRRKAFTFPIDWGLLRPFQREVLQIVYAIPYGETRTYAELARGIGAPGAARAVGSANGANRLAIIIPCHRVIAADGGLGGYGGGLWRKLRLLETEGVLLSPRASST